MREQNLGATSEQRLDPPVLGGNSLSSAERRDFDASARIPGWGTDLDPASRPGVPRDKAPEIGAESLYIDVEPQVPPHRIHKSTEHARLTPVFGTSCPPRGLSGRLRDFAYRHSEGRPSRWMALIAADRVDAIEGVVSDLLHGRPPNVVREMGLRSEWQHNRQRVFKVAAAATVAVAVLYLLRRRPR